MLDTSYGTCQAIIDFDNEMHSIKYHLDMLQQDQKLIDDGWKIHYAVDYSELYRYAFYIDELLKKIEEGSLNREAARIFVSKHCATKQLLQQSASHRSGKIILLQPYATELAHHISIATGASMRASFQNKRLQEIEIAIIRDEDRWLMREVVAHKKNRPDEPLPEELMQDSVNFLVRNFRELLLLQLATEQRGIEAIRALLAGDEPAIQFASEIVNDTSGRVSERDIAQLEDDPWFLAFQKKRGNYFSDVGDTQAMKIIERVNRSLANDRQVLLIYSDAPTMSRVLNCDLMERHSKAEYTGPLGIAEHINRDYRLLRTPRTLLIKSICTESGNGDLGEEILKRLAEIRQYFIDTSIFAQGFHEHLVENCHYYKSRKQKFVVEDGGAKCEDCHHFRHERALVQILDKYRKAAAEYENVRLYRQIIRTDERAVGRIEGVRHSVAQVIHDFGEMIISEAKRDMDKWNIQLEKRQRGLADTVSEIRREVGGQLNIADTSFDISQNVYRWGRFIGITHHIVFSDEDIAIMLDGIATVINRMATGMNGVCEFDDLAKSIVQYSGEREGRSTEKQIIRAALSYVYNERQYCLEILKRLELKGADVRVDYMTCIALGEHGVVDRSPRNVQDALEHAHRAMTTYPAELPIQYIYYKVMTRDIAVQIRRRGVTEQNRIDVRDAVEKLHTLLLAEMTPRTRLSVLNLIGYCVFLVGLSGQYHIEMCISTLREMESITASLRVVSPNYEDTMGCVALFVARNMQEISERQGYIDKSIFHNERAFDIAQRLDIPRREQNIINRHKLELADIVCAQEE